MKVRMLVSIAGHPEPRYGLVAPWSYAPGDLPDLDPQLAAAWIACGHAEKLPTRARSLVLPIDPAPDAEIR